MEAMTVRSERDAGQHPGGPVGPGRGRPLVTGPSGVGGPTPGLALDPAGFDAVFELQHDRMLRIAGLLCGDRDEAEDVVAEVFARTYRRWQKGGIDDVGAYLRRGVVNEVKSRWRKRSVRRRVHERRTRDDQLEAPGADAAVGEAQRLQDALVQLPDRQRAAIVLRFYDDRSEAETAAVLGIPVGTVKSSVARGLARLAVLLGEPGVDGQAGGQDAEEER
jgi:RNA polymerase sigma-70 factor (sigma-E family)